MTRYPATWLGRPISRRVPVRWSTALLTGGFMGLGVLYLEVGPDSDDDEPDQQIVVVPATSVETRPVDSLPVGSAPPVATSVEVIAPPETAYPETTPPEITRASPSTDG